MFSLLTSDLATTISGKGDSKKEVPVEKGKVVLIHSVISGFHRSLNNGDSRQ